MKLYSYVSTVLVSLSLLTAASAQDPVKFNVPGVSAPAGPAAAPAKAPAAAASPTPAAAPTKTPAAAPAAPTVKFTEAQLMEAFGYIFVLQTRMADQMQALEFTPAHKEAMLRGIGLALNGKDLPYDPQQIQLQLQEFMGQKQETFMTKLRMKNLTDNVAYFTKLKENKNIIELPSGLRYEVLKPGTGPAPKLGQMVKIHYTGTLVNGQTFDSSVERGQPIDLPMSPITAENPMGTIPGMVEGLQKIGVGGKAKFYIPPSLAYGDAGNQGIPPGAALIFEVEVVEAKDAPKVTPPPAGK
jgi:FKBP-type peptidyl-prolyl cis-trans isomerase